MSYFTGFSFEKIIRLVKKARFVEVEMDEDELAKAIDISSMPIRV